MNRKQEKTIQLTFKLDVTLHQKVKLLANIRGMSLKELITEQLTIIASKLEYDRILEVLEQFKKSTINK